MFLMNQLLKFYIGRENWGRKLEVLLLPKTFQIHDYHMSWLKAVNVPVNFAQLSLKDPKKHSGYERKAECRKNFNRLSDLYFNLAIGQRK